MATGINRLNRLQWVREVTPGTPVGTATTRWRGAGSMLDDQRRIEEIDEWMGIIEGADRTSVVQLLGMIALADTPLTAEQVQYLMVMGMGGPTTGAADGVGTDKIYVTNIPTTTKPTTTSYTLQGGDDFEVEQMEYTVCTKISLKGAMGQTVKMGGSLMGRQVARLAGGFTAAAIPAVGEFPCQLGKLYMDAIGGAYGATQVSTTLLAWNVDLELKWQPTFTMDGNLYYAYPSYVGHKITGGLTYLHDTPSGGASGALFDFRNQTPKLMRIDLSGDAVATPGTLYSTKKLLIDLPIKLLNPGPVGNDSGNNMYQFKFRSRYNTTAGNAGKFTVVNENTTLI